MIIAAWGGVWICEAVFYSRAELLTSAYDVGE